MKKNSHQRFLKLKYLAILGWIFSDISPQIRPNLILAFQFIAFSPMLRGHDNVEMDRTRGHVANS